MIWLIDKGSFEQNALPLFFFNKKKKKNSLRIKATRP